MKPSIRRLTGLAAVVGLAALVNIAITTSAPAGAPPPGKSIVWQTDFNKALAQAKQQHKLLMIDFYTEG